LKMSYPRIDLLSYVVIPVWYECNNECLICMLAPVKGKLPSVSFEMFRKLIMQIINDGRYRNLILSGAEVTTFEPLLKYVQFAASLGWFKKIQIQTNGRRLSDRDYLKSLVHAGVNEFFVSIQGQEEVHDLISRRPGSYRETLEGIHNLESLRVNFITNTVLTRLNYHQVADLMAQMCESAARELHVWNFFPMQKADTGDLIVSIKDLLALFSEILPFARASGKPLVLKAFPECLAIEEPGVLDGRFPMTLIPDVFWKELRESGFGTCVYRNECKVKGCWGLSSAYIRKYGDERDLLSPVREDG